MQYGCIGEKLSHSFSKSIHEKLGQYSYELIELAPAELADFMTEKNFKAINVTIPYKQAVIPFLYEMSDMAKAVGAVNTVVNRDGRLYGYNTDFYGLSRLIERSTGTVKNKKVLITGSGGTSKTALAVVKAMGAAEVYRVSRTGREDCITYADMYDRHKDAEVIINASPVGMFPELYRCPVELDRLIQPSLVIDAVYNPVQTMLISSARKKGIAAEGGLYMLTAQAVRAYEIFTGNTAGEDTAERVYSQVLSEKRNIVLTGMPMSGKTTAGQVLAKRLGREFIDTDDEIIKLTGTDIPEYFRKYGEKSFRDAESEVIKKVSAVSGAVVATGGGAVLRRENVERLKMNGVIYFIDRPLSELAPAADRPLAGTRQAIRKLYEERYDIYISCADEILKTDGDCADTVEEIERRHFR
ncbi:MAG: shikimate dehydrogenase [Clostridia bacterium]|nr:shikimate dehydrogenase [Clostridia bacterium]